MKCKAKEPTVQCSRFGMHMACNCRLAFARMCDHGSIKFVWRSWDAEKGHAIGLPPFNKGNSVDWMVTAAAPDEDLHKATTCKP